jgi:peptidyl-prolyl cis-trans isomerase C
VLLAALLPALACAPAEKSSEAPSDTGDKAEVAVEVVAEVNGRPITNVQLDKVVDAEEARMADRNETPTDDVLREMRREAMRLVVSSELCFQAAEAQGIEVPEEEIDRQLEGARSQFSSEEDFRESLSNSGMSFEQLVADVRRRLTIERYLAGVSPTFEADSEDAKRIFDEQRDQFKIADEIHVARIIVRFLPRDSDQKKAKAREKIDAAWRRLQSGEAFETVAREMSESPMAAKGGDLGWFKRGRTLPEFEDKVFSTPVGEMTGVFETRHGYNIAKVLGFKPGRPQTFEEAQTGLMMVLARERRDEYLREHVRGLWDAAEIRFVDPDLEPAPPAD